MKDKIFKVLAHGQKSCHGGDLTWEVGKWYTVKGKLIPCENGIHLCRPEHLLDWLHEEIWEAEYKGKMIDHGDKLVVRSARIIRQCENWNDHTARLFACDCAQDVAYLNPDPRVQNCIDVARSFANGEVTQKELDAAWDAAWDAARDAAWDAARAAAWDAARAAARDAARDAARAAAWAAARDAARAAARDAVWAAARAAVWDAAGAAARDAAGAAVWAAARAAQTKRLMKYLSGTLPEIKYASHPRV